MTARDVLRDFAKLLAVGFKKLNVSGPPSVFLEVIVDDLVFNLGGDFLETTRDSLAFLVVAGIVVPKAVVDALPGFLVLMIVDLNVDLGGDFLDS